MKHFSKLGWARVAWAVFFVTAPVYVQAASPQQVLTGLYNAYSPEVFIDPTSSTTRMLVGGWAREADIGADVLYSTTLRNGKAGKLTKSFVFRGYHANDPSVIQNPLKPKELLMFFTALKNENATAEKMMKTNWVAVARSTDGGKQWKRARVLIGQNNGFDARGAWSPSAVVAGNEIWVYYHTNGPGLPDIYRTRVRATDLSIVETEPATANGARLSGINVDVVYHQGLYHMLVGATLQDNNYFTSRDGLVWTLASTTAFVRAGEGKSIITPSFVLEKSGLTVYYSVGPVVSGANYRYDSVYRIPFGQTSTPMSSVPRVEPTAGIVTGTVTARGCTVGIDRNTINPKNTLACDSSVSWTTNNAQSAYVVISGAAPYDTASFPYGAAAGNNTAGDKVAFWTKEGIYTATLYVGGVPPTQTRAGTGWPVDSTTFTVKSKATPVAPGKPVGGSVSVKTCTVGLNKSTADPTNALICDASVSWSTENATNAFVVISGDFPYDRSSFPNGYVAGSDELGSDAFWVTSGTYTAKLYVNGTPPTNNRPATGTVVDSETFTIHAPATSAAQSLGQMANVLEAIRGLLKNWR